MPITPDSLIEKEKAKEKKVFSLPDEKAQEFIDTEENTDVVVLLFKI